MEAKFIHEAVIGIFLTTAMLTTGCSDNDYGDVDGQSPTVELVTEHIYALPGDDVTLTATLTDADGICTVRLQNADLYLDKTIDLIAIYGEPQTSYKLAYTIALSENLKQKVEYPVIITVTDVGGRSVQHTVIVSTDKDTSNPVIDFYSTGEVTALAKGTVPFHFIASDGQGLGYVEVSVGALNFTQKVNAENKTMLDSFVNLPITQTGTYQVDVKVADSFDNEVTATSTYKVNLVNEMPDFEKMYLCDVENAKGLTSDVFGVPMRIERTGAYTYKADYYSQRAGTEIFFLPQKTDMMPFCFGIDPDNTNLLTYEPDRAKPIVLDKSNVYYEITFNISTGAYSMRTYSIEEAIDPLPHQIGSNSLDTWGNGTDLREFYIGYMTTTPPEVERLAQDATNPHLFTIQLSLKANEKMNFAIHNWHPNEWWDYCSWYVDTSNGGSGNEPEIFGYYGSKVNENWTGNKLSANNRSWATPTVTHTGKYQLVFDAYLGKAKLIPTDNN